MGLKRCIALLLLVGAVPSNAGPFEDGTAAYDREDYSAAAKFFAQGAAQGDSRSQGLLGIMYVYGVGVSQDAAQGIQWLKLAAKNGNAAALNSLGNVYSKGQGVQQDWSTAISYYVEAAKAGNANAQNALGDVYLLGRGGVKSDYAKANSWYELAAKNGNAEAEYNLGSMNYFGWGMEVNYANAVSWFTLAAKQDNVMAELMLGHSYFNGRGVPQDYFEGIQHYAVAARRGNLTALGLLGESYFNGHGVGRDVLKSYALMNIAASQMTGDIQKSAIEERDQSARLLTPSQLAAAQAMASRCTKDLANCEAIPGTKTLPYRPPANLSGSATARAAQIELAGTGSGFYINAQGQIVTNAHVIQECAAVMTASGSPLRTVALDADSDLAVLSSGQKQQSYARVRGGKGARIGESVIAVGFPLPGVLGEGAKVSSGTISALAGLGNDRRNIQISTPVQPGNSGGPLVGDDGAIVGVVSGKLDALKMASTINDIPQNVNFAVSLGTLQSFLNGNNVAYAVATPRAGQTGAALSAEAARYTVRLECWK